MANTNYTREQIIQYGVDNRYPVERIDSALSKKGKGKLNTFERGLIATGRWGTNPIERLGQDAKEFVQGLGTAATMATTAAGDMVLDPIGTSKKGLQAVSKYAKEKGVGGAVNDVVSMIGEPYGVTGERTREQGLGQVLADLPGRIYAHPGFAAVDIGLPLAGKFPTHQVGDALAKVNAPKVIRDFIPSTNISKVNTAINEGRGLAGTGARQRVAQTNQILDSLTEAEGAQVARNLQLGVRNGGEKVLKATEELNQLAREYNKDLVKLGVNENKAREVAIAQRIMEVTNPTRSNPITVDSISKALLGNAPDVSFLRRHGVSTDRLNTLAEQSGKLFDEGKIFPLSHRATFKSESRVPGLVTEADKQLGQLAERRYGKATPEELFPTLGKAYADTQREITQARSGLLSLDNVANSIGRKINFKDMANILDDELVISPRMMEDLVKSDFQRGVTTSIKDRLRQMASVGADSQLASKYRDNLYVVKRKDMEPLINLANSKSSSGWIRGLNNLWKTAQLITPKYFLENRIGNTILNAIEGVTIQDWLEGLSHKNPVFGFEYKGKYADIKPERLKADTSYHGVLGEEFTSTTTGRAFQKSIKELNDGWKNKDFKQIMKGTYDMVSAPILSMEAGFEGADRYANFIRQAKRLSASTGESVENIIKRASKDQKLYAELMGQVNRSLGDYVGRNWAINPSLYEGLNLAFPFFKYPTQGLRTLTHQAMNKPLSFASKVTLPQRIGNEVWKEQVARYPSIANEMGGIVQGQEGDPRYPATILQQSDVNPLGAGAGLLSNALGDWRNINVSPFMNLARITQFRDRYGNPASSPKYTNYKGKMWINDSQGRPTPRIQQDPTLGDYTSYLTSEMMNQFYPPVIFFNRVAGPGIAALTDQEWYPKYDTSILGQIGRGNIPEYLRGLMSGKVNKPGRGREEILKGQIGIRTLRVYPEQSVNARDVRGLMRKYNRSKVLNSRGGSR